MSDLSNGQNKKRNKTWSKVLFTLLGVVIIVAIASAAYLNDYYRADMNAIEGFLTENPVEMRTDRDGNLVFEPEETVAGLIFYPGGKVEYTAYIPLMKALASEGIFGVLVEMPFHLAVFDVDAADGIQEQYPQIKDWYIGGHSLGGSMAASYLDENEDDFEGLVLLGSYSTEDLRDENLSVISVYGSEDRVLNREKYEANKRNLPRDFQETIIDGGCHAYFGMYGAQAGDGVPTITNKEQIALAVDAITDMVVGVK